MTAADPNPSVVLCYGDSNTHGSIAMRDPDDRRRLPRGARWPGVLSAALGAGWQVIEEGHPGRTTVHDDPVEGAHKNGLAMLRAVLETHRPIDTVVLMLGTNDLKARFAVPAADIARSLDRLIAVVATSEAGPAGAAPGMLLIAPAPISETGCLGAMFAGGAAKSRQLGALVSAQAEKHDIPFIDAARHAQVDPTDGIHLDAPGHAALGRAVADALRATGRARDRTADEGKTGC